VTRKIVRGLIMMGKFAKINKNDNTIEGELFTKEAQRRYEMMLSNGG
jgi:hypothetical protein